MNFQELLNLRADRPEGPTLATLIGVGEFGRSFIAQSLAISGLDLAALCDLDIERVIDNCRRAGLSDGDLAVCSSVRDAGAQRDLGKVVVDLQIFEALAGGYLSAASGFLEPA